MKALFLINLVSFTLLHGVTTAVQAQDYTPYQHPRQVLSPQNGLSETEIEDKIQRILLEKYGHVRYDVQAFSEEQAQSTSFIHQSGIVYQASADSRVEKLERYLNDILKRVVPAEYMDRYQFRAFLFRDESVNAFTLSSALIYLHPALIAECRNEDELAMVLAHEVAHSIGYDVFESFQRRKKLGRFDGYGLLDLFQTSRYLAFEREQETRADSIGAEFIDAAGYSSYVGVRIFQVLESIKERMELEHGASGNGGIYGSTHPSNDHRQALITGTQIGSVKETVTPAFLEAKKFCAYETMNILISSGQYDNAVVMGWRFLANWRDADMTQLCFDALRRYMLVAPNLDRKRSILASNYKLATASASKGIGGTSDYDEDRLQILFLGDDMHGYPAPLNNPELSYESLYNTLFEGLKLQKNCNECLLQLGLATAGPQSDSLLRVYANSSTSPRAAYARFVLGDRADSAGSVQQRSVVAPYHLNIQEISSWKYTVLGAAYRTTREMGYDEASKLLGFEGENTPLKEKNQLGNIDVFTFKPEVRSPYQLFGIEQFSGVLHTLSSNQQPLHLALLVDPNMYEFLMTEGIGRMEILSFEGQRMEHGGRYSPISLTLAIGLYSPSFVGERIWVDFSDLENVESGKVEHRIGGVILEKRLVKMFNGLYATP